MSAVRVAFELTNSYDLVLADRGLLARDRVRHTTSVGVVGTAAMLMILPRRVVERLGLRISKMPVSHGGETRELATDARVRLFGRAGTSNAIVDPNRTDALPGGIVLLDLDRIVDRQTNELVPRDPTTIICEIE